LEKGRTITRQYYAQLLGRSDDALEEKRPHLAKKKANVPAHRSLAAAPKLVKLGCELLPHPPNSPDLTSCHFLLWPNIKKLLGLERFASNEENTIKTNQTGSSKNDLQGLKRQKVSNYNTY
jgi:hypothetical protein